MNMKLILGQNTIVSLQKESVDAISLFRKTITKLNLANEKVKTEISLREVKIDTLVKENITLVEIATSNNKFISKITEFLT